MSGSAPNLRPYTVLASIVPVATDEALTVPTDTVEVMYLDAAEAPKLGPTTARAIAPTPTSISPIAANLSFIGVLPFDLALVAAVSSRPGASRAGRYPSARIYIACRPETTLKRPLGKSGVLAAVGTVGHERGTGHAERGPAAPTWPPGR
jgi:hypothetical protein